MSPQVFMHTPRPGDRWRKDCRHIRRTLLAILAEGGNSWQSVMKTHDALWRVEKMAKDLIAESEHLANTGECEAGAPAVPTQGDE